MPYRPNKQDPDHHALHLFALENTYVRLRPKHVNFDLFKVFLLKFTKTYLRLRLWVLLLAVWTILDQ
jgi:hypothetical protein